MRRTLHIGKMTDSDLVVLDINLPHMDGLEFMGRLLEEQPQLPFIINTAYSYQDNFMSWAANGYVCKSSDLSELKARIRELLDNHALPIQA